MRDARRIERHDLGGRGRDGLRAWRPSPHAEPIQEPQRAQLRHFSFFRTAARGPPRLEPEDRKKWKKPKKRSRRHPFLRGCDGLNAELAQKVEGIPGRRIFVIPGDGCMEMVNQGPVARIPTRSSPASAATRKRSSTACRRAGFRAGFGIVPDGAIAAKLSPTLTVPVVRGTFFKVRYRGLDVSKLWTKARLVFGASAGNG